MSNGVKNLREILPPAKFKLAVLVAQGFDNREIAEHTGLSTGVVKNYLRAVFDLVGCDNRHQLAARYVREKISGEYRKTGCT
jgi:DNA-binding NarL/FixJ family response regulator